MAELIMNEEGSTPSTPTSGKWKVFPKADGLHTLDDAGSDAFYRQQLTAARTYYVRPNGSDSNNGLANTAGGAFLTLQKAWDTLSGLDMGTSTVTVQVASGTYTGGINIDKGPIGLQKVLFVGDTTTPANVVISVAGNAVSAVSPCNVSFDGFKFTTTAGGHCVITTNPSSVISLEKVNFGSAGGDHIRVTSGKVFANSNYTISGGAAYHMLALLGGVIEASSVTVTVSGTPAFSSAFASAQNHGVISWYIPTFSGSATGTRYTASLNGVINTYTGVTLPGNAAGSTATGGQFA